MCPDLLDALLEPHREAEQLGGADSGFSLHVVLGFFWGTNAPFCSELELLEAKVRLIEI